MLYDFRKDFDVEMYRKRSEELIKEKAKVELNKKREKRTLIQNAYLHVCINMYAIFVGERLEKTKQTLKQLCSFMHVIEGDFIYLFSSTDLNTKEMTNWVEWIRNYASEKGVFIPSPEEYRRNWVEYEKQIQACKPYL